MRKPLANYFRNLTSKQHNIRNCKKINIADKRMDRRMNENLTAAKPHCVLCASLSKMLKSLYVGVQLVIITVQANIPADVLSILCSPGGSSILGEDRRSLNAFIVPVKFNRLNNGRQSVPCSLRESGSESELDILTSIICPSSSSSRLVDRGLRSVCLLYTSDAADE